MSPSERRSAILDLLCERRHETTANLAALFGVTERTIRSDLTALSCSCPIQMVRGRYGGIRVDGDFRRDRQFLSSKQTALLKKLIETLEGDELTVMKGILAQFTHPTDRV